MTLREAGGRISAIALAGLLSGCLAAGWARWIGPAHLPPRVPVEARHRSARPAWKSGGGVLIQLFLVGGIALAGRKLLRIRLTGKLAVEDKHRADMLES
jgi:hypothetical protein